MLLKQLAYYLFPMWAFVHANDTLTINAHAFSRIVGTGPCVQWPGCCCRLAPGLFAVVSASYVNRLHHAPRILDQITGRRLAVFVFVPLSGRKKCGNISRLICQLEAPVIIRKPLTAAVAA